MSLVGYIVFKEFFERKKDKPYKGTLSAIDRKLMGPDAEGFFELREAGVPLFEKLPFEILSMTAEDGTELKGRYLRNDSSEKTAVLIHGYRSSGPKGYYAIAFEYIKRGYSVFIPDLRASGMSGGKYTTFGLIESRDCAGWIKKLSEMYPRDMFSLHGISMGGATVCLMSGMDIGDRVRAIVADCPFADAEEELCHCCEVYLGKRYSKLADKTEKTLEKKTGLRFNDNSPLKSVSSSKYPMLFIHGAEDRFVPPENSEKLYDACLSEKEILIVPGAGHSSSYRTAPETYCFAVFGFLDRFFE